MMFHRRKHKVVIFASLACLTALASVTALPPEIGVVREEDGARTVESVSHNPWGYAFATAMLLSALAALGGVILFTRSRERLAGQFLIAATVFGIPAIVPGLLALLSLRKLRLPEG